MKKSRFCLVGLLVLALLELAGCGSDKYADAKSLMKDQARVTDNYVNGLDKAQNAEEAAQVIDTYTDEMKTLIPRIKTFREKYPELASMSAPPDAPEALKVEMKKLEQATSKIQSATMNMMKYMLDPKVQQALQRMGQELSAIGKP